jgi:hypothetical protein
VVYFPSGVLVYFLSGAPMPRARLAPGMPETMVARPILGIDDAVDRVDEATEYRAAPLSRQQQHGDCRIPIGPDARESRHRRVGGRQRHGAQDRGGHGRPDGHVARGVREWSVMTLASPGRLVSVFAPFSPFEWMAGGTCAL